MTTDMQSNQSTEQKQVSLGARLQAAREALSLDRKDAAAQLRLNEKIIIMIEKDRYATDIPVTFIRGYIRSYGKLLKIPDHEIKKAIDLVKPKAVSAATAKSTTPVTSGNYFMQLFTLLLIVTIAGLAGAWWYIRPTVTAPAVVAEVQPANNKHTASNPDTENTAPNTVPLQSTETTNAANTSSTVPQQTEQQPEPAEPAAAIEQLLNTQTQDVGTSQTTPVNGTSTNDDVQIYNNNAE
jgi:cytoskeleton protein RodZ